MRARAVLGWSAVAALTVLGSVRALLPVLGAPTPSEANKGLTVGQDFRDATYYPVRELLAGGDPYLPSNMFENWPVRQEYGLYAPSHLTLHAPFGLLDYRASLVVFSLVAIACVLAIGVVSARTYRLPGGWVSAWFVGALLVVAQPGKSAVFIGQINPLVALGGVLALTQARRHPGWAAVGLALAWTKPQYGIPLVLLLLARGAWREGLGGTVLAGVVSLPVLGVLVAREGLLDLVDVFRANVEYSATVARTAVDSMSGARTDTAAVLYRATGWIPPGAELVVFVVVVATAAVLLGRRGRGEPLDAAELLVASTACLICMVHQPGESLVTVPGLVLVAATLLRRQPVATGLCVPAVLVALPLVHFGFVGAVVQSVAGLRGDRLVEGLLLNVAFWLLVVHAVRSSRRVERPAVRADGR